MSPLSLCHQRIVQKWELQLVPYTGPILAGWLACRKIKMQVLCFCVWEHIRAGVWCTPHLSSSVCGRVYMHACRCNLSVSASVCGSERVLAGVWCLPCLSLSVCGSVSVQACVHPISQLLSQALPTLHRSHIRLRPWNSPMDMGIQNVWCLQSIQDLLILKWGNYRTQRNNPQRLSV